VFINLKILTPFGFGSKVIIDKTNKNHVTDMGMAVSYHNKKTDMDETKK